MCYNIHMETEDRKIPCRCRKITFISSGELYPTETVNRSPVTDIVYKKVIEEVHSIKQDCYIIEAIKRLL